MQSEHMQQPVVGAEQAASRLAALNRVGMALTSELDEERLLHLIAETARDLTEASFAAFTLRPIDDLGQPLVPSEGRLFYLAAVVGVTPDQEELFRRMPLGGEGLLSPIFRYGVPVLVPDALASFYKSEQEGIKYSHEQREAAREAAFDFAHGQLAHDDLRSLGVPRGHPVIRSFLGAPLLDRSGQIIGGLLLGHTEPGKFGKDDEAMLVGLAAQAAVALENARMYRAAQVQTQELDTIFESIGDGVTLVDSQGRILRENRSARRLREQLETTNTSANQNATSALLHEPARRALLGEAVQEMTVSLVDKRGELREYLVNVSPLRLPQVQSELFSFQSKREQDAVSGITGAVVVWHDVTEARRLLYEQRINAETEAQRALLQTILDELPSSVYLVRGRDARLVLANRAAAAVWGATWPKGQTMSEFLAQHDIRVFAMDGRPMAVDSFATVRAVCEGKTISQHQEIIRRPDGTSLPVIVNAVPIDPRKFNSQPQFGPTLATEELEPTAIVVHQDMTALKEAEQLKDEFIGIAAHELRTPISVVKGFAQTLIVQTARGNGPALADWQMESLQGIDQATLRLVELIDDLLDVTRLQAGRLTLHTEPLDLLSLTRRVVARMQMMAERHSISLSTPPDYIIVNIDPRRMEQVLSNLIGNAVKYSPSGGAIEVETWKDEDREQQEAVLSIRDYGIGIPAQQQARLFSRFVRADNASAHGIGGTGLGLYLCRELIERQGGRIWFQSVEGKGSTFYVALPLAREISGAL